MSQIAKTFNAHTLLADYNNIGTVKNSVKFSSHAAEKMIRRNVKISDVYTTLSYPDGLYQDVEHKTLIAIKKVKAKFIVVAYKMENGGAKVITLFYTTKLDRLLKSKTVRGAWKKTR